MTPLLQALIDNHDASDEDDAYEILVYMAHRVNVEKHDIEDVLVDFGLSHKFSNELQLFCYNY